MGSEFCGECEGPMILVEKANGETFLSCQQCGETRENQEDYFEFTQDAGSSSFAMAGEGAKPEGYRYERNSISEGRRRGKSLIQTLCQHFNLSTKLQQEMFNLFERVKYRKIDVACGAIFLSVVRRQQARENTGEQITIRQVSAIVSVPIPKIASCLKYVESLLDDKLSSGGITDAGGIVRSVLPKSVLHDPFLADVDITNRVLQLTEKIIQLIMRRSSKSIEPTYTTIAACYLAWQSCFFYQKKYHAQVPLESLKSPAKMSTLSEYLSLAKIHVTDTTIQAIRRSYVFILYEMSELLEKMPWIPFKRGKTTKIMETVVPQYVEQILEFQGLTCDVLHTEAEIKRRNEPIITPVVPRELTAEEEAVLDVPELSEKDLPDKELSIYLRSVEEVDALKRWMDSSTSDSELN